MGTENHRKVDEVGKRDALSVVTYDWSAIGELTRITDAEGNRTTLSYDLRGLRTALKSPDAGLIEERFDLMGNRVALIEPNHRALGAQVSFSYELDRLVGVDYPSKPDVTYVYGAPGAPSGRAGRIAEVRDETGRVETFYGALGEVVRTVREVDPGQPGRLPIRFDTRFVHDSMGRLLRLTYPDGEIVTNVYDAGGQLAAVRGAGAGWSRTYVDELQYDVFGNRVRARAGNGAVSTWTFDPARVRLSEATTTLASGEAVQDLRYRFDPVGNPTKIETLLEAPGPGSDLPGGSTLRLTYDGVDRLVRARGTSALAPAKSTAYEQTFAYSPSHNLLHKKRDHFITQPSGVPVAPPHTNIDLDYAYGGRPHLPTRVGDLEITYDPSGNPKHRRTIDTGHEEHLTWDDDGRMVEIQKGGTFQRNTYDAAGLRVIRRGRQGETIFASPFFDLEPGTQGVKHIFAGDTRVASVLAHYEAPTASPGAGKNAPAPADTAPLPPKKPGTAYFFHQDHLGSTSVLTNERGDVHEHLQYFPDGEVWIDHAPQQPVNGYLFSGKPFDPETGFSDFGQRFYDPKTSLFLGMDPALIGDVSIAVGQPINLAAMAYAAQSPIRFIDPDGRGWLDRFTDRILRIDNKYGVSKKAETVGRAAVIVGAGAAVALSCAGTVGGTCIAAAVVGSVYAGEAGHELITDEDQDHAIRYYGGDTVGDFFDTGVGVLALAEGAALIRGRASTTSTVTLGADDVQLPAGGPTEAYNRLKHYGRTPTKADRRAVGARAEEVADHDPPLVQRYYEGDPATGEMPGFSMTPQQRRASAADRSRMKRQPRTESNKQGAEMQKYWLSARFSG